jgi:hypothetical protein
MKLTQEIIKKMMRSIQSTREQELTCGACYDEVDRFVELELSGKNAAEAMPLVREHLDRCGTCKEEYEALLDALKAILE